MQWEAGIAAEFGTVSKRLAEGKQPVREGIMWHSQVKLLPPMPGLLMCGASEVGLNRTALETGQGAGKKKGRVLLGPPQKIQCLVPVLTTDPSDPHHTRIYF